MKTKIEGNYKLRENFDYGLEDIFQDRDIHYTSCGASPFKINYMYQYSIGCSHIPSGISVKIYERSFDRDDEQLINRLKSETYEELRYLVCHSPRYLSLVLNKKIIRNRLLGFERWEETEK